ncbi:MAG: S8 family peptidase [Bdellovibrionaceae bacterium]|nr:S8 family peptidase [Pseudobdellovibrionaceae bacterium]
MEGKPGYDLKLESLNLPSEGIEVLSVKIAAEDDGERVIASVFVQDDKLGKFIEKINDYKTKETANGNPKNSALVTSIENLRLGVVRSLWTDTDVFPDPQEVIWWEVWLKREAGSFRQFSDFSTQNGVRIGNKRLLFLDREVVLAHASANQFSVAIERLSCVAELRRAKEITSDFLRMAGSEQAAWCAALNGITDLVEEAHRPVVCILDTGVDRSHSLLSRHLPERSLFAYKDSWRTSDHHGHGTQMAGLIIYGDLEEALQSTERLIAPCDLESVKILPPQGENDPELYGSITEDAAATATVSSPYKNRIYCMALTTGESRDRGQPSSWSASLDNACAGITIQGQRNLFVVASGNANPTNHVHYPDSNFTDGVQDPAQSWNALTVGSYTEKVGISEGGFVGWQPLAPLGGLGPSCTTSLTWEAGKWPNKPDILFEGGNAAINEDGSVVDYPGSLLPLTVCRTIGGRSFTWMADTSAAAAKAANFAARIFSDYPEYWPETVRALMVHSAEWTDEMKSYFDLRLKRGRQQLLRTCGYGVPNLARARWSSNNVLTLIAQSQLRPFEGDHMKDINFHSIPWPSEVLRELGDTPVDMRVTLSYFIEPNPSRRGWKFKFNYQSHGLRFDVKNSLESEEEFSKRLNKAQRSAQDPTRATGGDSEDWYFGEAGRSRGSLHSDVWSGSAAELAEKAQIAVYPVMGWWRERHREGHTTKFARYSLVITLSTPSTDVDLYTPVENYVQTQVRV